MQISIKIDTYLIDGNLEILKRNLGWNLPKNQPDLNSYIEEKFTKLAETSLIDYLEMLLGSPLPNRAVEFKEKRLLHLILHYLDEDEFFDETQVASMFQTSESEGRALLKNVRSRYRNDIDNRVRASLTSILNVATPLDSDNWQVLIKSENLVEALKQIVTINLAELPQISKVPGSAAYFQIVNDTYIKLCSYFGTEIKKNTIKAKAKK